MLAAAEAADAQEDETFGKDKRGDELPDWTGDKQKRLAKIQQAMAALEAEAPSRRRRKSVGSKLKRNSSAKPKAARSRANRRRRHRRSPIPRRSATSPIRKAAS